MLKPSDQARLDDRLSQLLKRLNSAEPYEVIAREACAILGSISSKPPEQPGPEASPEEREEYERGCKLEGPGYKVLRPRWQEHWKQQKEVSWGWFGAGDLNEEQRALHAAVTEMVRLVEDANTDYRRQVNMAQLSGLLADYLDRRGFTIKPPSGSPSAGAPTPATPAIGAATPLNTSAPPPPPGGQPRLQDAERESGLSEAQLAVLQAVDHLAANGWPTRAADIASQAGYKSASHARGILSELVHRGLLVSTSHGYKRAPA
jgi:hypothetical protein